MLYCGHFNIHCKEVISSFVNVVGPCLDLTKSKLRMTCKIVSDILFWMCEGILYVVHVCTSIAIAQKHNVSKQNLLSTVRPFMGGGVITWITFYELPKLGR